MTGLVYVCEDDEVMRKLLRRLIERLVDATVISFERAEAALVAASEKPPDLIISDIYHPGPSGLELVRELRGLIDASELPIWIISGHARLHRRDALEAGATLVLDKPFRIDELEGHLRPLFPVRGDLVDLDVEGPDFDIKERPGTDNRDGAAALAKDVIAMANFGGGRILFGKRDEGNGAFTLVGLSEDDRQLLEVTRLNQALSPFLEPPLHVSPRAFRRGPHILVEITVPPGEELMMAACQNDRARLYPGRIYVRTTAAASSEARTAHEVRRILARLAR